MVTALGKFLRKLRIDNNELLLDMANLLGVSSAFLSKVENGKAKPPEEWLTEIVKHYALPEEEENTLEQLFFYQRNDDAICMRNYSEGDKEMMLSFARKLSMDAFDEQQLETIREFLSTNKE